MFSVHVWWHSEKVFVERIVFYQLPLCNTNLSDIPHVLSLLVGKFFCFFFIFIHANVLIVLCFCSCVFLLLLTFLLETLVIILSMACIITCTSMHGGWWWKTKPLQCYRDVDRVRTPQVAWNRSLDLLCQHIHFWWSGLNSLDSDFAQHIVGLCK